MLRLVVHADDFGLSERINEGIKLAHTQGILTSASIMAGGAAFEHAVDICRSTPTLDVGIHLTLAEERPLLDPASVPSLVNADGRFHGHATGFTKAYFRGRINLEEVRRELDAQIATVLSRNIRVTHVDSHQHLHMLPGVLRTVVSLARHHGIPRVRFPGERVRPYMLRDVSSLSRVGQLLGLRYFCFLGKSAELARPDHFAGFYYGGRLNKQHLREVLANLPSHGTCELMCHPGLEDPDTRYPHWGYKWSEELDALVDPELPELLRRRRIVLIPYGDVA